MTGKKFREHMNARPFRPYTVCLADGQALKVVHPDFVAGAQDGREATVHGEKGGYNLIDLLLVTAIRIEAGPESITAVED